MNYHDLSSSIELPKLILEGQLNFLRELKKEDKTIEEGICILEQIIKQIQSKSDITPNTKERRTVA